MPQFAPQQQDNQTLISSSLRWLSGHRPCSPRDRLKQLSLSPWADSPADVYGDGPAIAALESRVAQLLGKEAALFVHKGVTAQLMALKVWTETSGVDRVVLHRKSHIEWDEGQAYETVMGLQGLRQGTDHTHFSVQDLDALSEPLGLVTLELPLRRAGFILPSWSELSDLALWCRTRGLPLHLDGARLWESAPYYGKSLAAIASVADSVYVSFYKGLGGLSGSILAGTEEFIQKCRIWKTRLGGTIATQFPQVIAAHEGLDLQLPRMAEYHERAKELAAALQTIHGVRVNPDPPHTNSFQVFLPGKRESLLDASRHYARTHGFWLFGSCQPTSYPLLNLIEIVIGDNHRTWTTDEVVAAFRTIVEG